MIQLTVKGMDQALRDLKALALSPKRKARVLRKMGNHVAKASRLRITRQEEVSGAPFAPRKPRDDDKKARKLLQGFRRNIRVRLEGDHAVIAVSAGLWGFRARQHQEGFTQVVQAGIAAEQARLVRRGRAKGATGQPGAMATKHQAKRLRELGWKKSAKWIMQTYSRSLAGFLIRKEEGRAPKSSWTIVVPKRPFLGASNQDIHELGRILEAELAKAA
jgi:hypothetical protein